jgi:hypothetical protein
MWQKFFNQTKTYEHPTHHVLSRHKIRPALLFSVCTWWEKICCFCSRLLSEYMSLNCGHQRAYCSSPRWYMCMESHGGMILAGGNRRSRRKTCPSAIMPVSIPRGLIRERTWASVGKSLLSCQWTAVVFKPPDKLTHAYYNTIQISKEIYNKFSFEQNQVIMTDSDNRLYISDHKRNGLICEYGNTEWDSRFTRLWICSSSSGI